MQDTRSPWEIFDSTVKVLILEHSATPDDLIGRMKEVSLSVPKQPKPEAISALTAKFYLRFLTQKFGNYTLDIMDRGKPFLSTAVKGHQIRIYFEDTSLEGLQSFSFQYAVRTNVGVRDISELSALINLLLSEQGRWKPEIVWPTAEFSGSFLRWKFEDQFSAERVPFLKTQASGQEVRIYFDDTLPESSTPIACTFKYTSGTMMGEQGANALFSLINIMRGEYESWRLPVVARSTCMFRLGYLLSAFGQGARLAEAHSWKLTLNPEILIGITALNPNYTFPEKMGETIWQLRSARHRNEAEASRCLQEIFSSHKEPEHRWLKNNHPKEFQKHVTEEYFEPEFIEQQFGASQSLVAGKRVWTTKLLSEAVIIEGSTDPNYPVFTFVLETLLPDGQNKLQSFVAELRKKAFAASKLKVPEVGELGSFHPEFLDAYLGQSAFQGDETVWDYINNKRGKDSFRVKIKSLELKSRVNPDRPLYFWVAIKTDSCAGSKEASFKLNRFIADLERKQKEWLNERSSSSTSSSSKNWEITSQIYKGDILDIRGTISLAQSFVDHAFGEGKYSNANNSLTWRKWISGGEVILRKKRGSQTDIFRVIFQINKISGVRFAQQYLTNLEGEEREFLGDKRIRLTYNGGFEPGFIHDTFGEGMVQNGCRIWRDRTNPQLEIEISCFETGESWKHGVESRTPVYFNFIFVLILNPSTTVDQARGIYIQNLAVQHQVWASRKHSPEIVRVSALDEPNVKPPSSTSGPVNRTINLSPKFLWDKFSRLANDDGRKWSGWRGLLENITLTFIGDPQKLNKDDLNTQPFDLSCSTGDLEELDRACKIIEDCHRDYQARNSRPKEQSSACPVNRFATFFVEELKGNADAKIALLDAARSLKQDSEHIATLDINDFKKVLSAALEKSEGK